MLGRAAIAYHLEAFRGKLIAWFRASTMEKILLTVEAEIEEVSQDGNGYTAEGMKRVAVLSYMATMLRTEIKKKALQN